MRIETKTDNRRKMVQDIAEFTGEELRYVGPPTFSYTVGRLTIDRDGVITSETEEGEDLLTQFLQEKGYLEAPVDEVKIEIPADTGDGKFLQNLLAMIHARAYLLNQITRYETFAVSDSLLEKLEQLPEENAYEIFQTLLTADTEGLKGLMVEDGKVTFAFPLSPDSAKNKASNTRKLQQSLVPLGEKLAEIANTILPPLVSVIQTVSGWFAQLPGPVQNFIVILGALLAAFTALTPVIAALAVSVGALNISLLPIIAVIAAVAAAIACFLAVSI